MKQTQIIKPAGKPRPLSLDLRTPSGRPLPY
jgi:hypothetical protein